MNFKLSGALSPAQLESIAVFSWGVVVEIRLYFVKEEKKLKENL